MWRAGKPAARVSTAPESWAVRRAQVGGALYLGGSSMTLSGCTFDGCTATATGDFQHSIAVRAAPRPLAYREAVGWRAG